MGRPERFRAAALSVTHRKSDRMRRNNNSLRIAAVGDLHCNKNSQGQFQQLFSQANAQADILVLCGDLTDYGLPEEAQILARELSGVKIPIVGVLGNHDYESNQSGEVTAILKGAGVRILDGDSMELEGVGFAGVKGFAGGFGRGTLGHWGEMAVKAFVEEAVNEALKLESALARLRTPQKIAVLHYAPIQATVENEPKEIFPFLGTSRLEGPFNRYPVNAIFHGHAHNGTAEGKTVGGIPVYNVCHQLLSRINPGQPPFRILELSRGQVEGTEAGG